MKAIKLLLTISLMSILIIACDLEENNPIELMSFEEDNPSVIDPEFVMNSSSLKKSDTDSVKVFILAGQSNMEGKAIVKPSQNHLDKNKGKGTLRYLVDKAQGSTYKHLVDSSGDWSKRNDVWLVDVKKSGPLTINGKNFGPELQFGHIVGDYFKNNTVLLIKTAWGGKSLYEDFRPPSSGGKVGPEYKLMIKRIHEVLNNIKNFYPDYNGQGYEIVGFGWHQGWNDRVNDDAVAEYQENCVNLINDLRDELKLPNLPFVLATTGMTGWDTTSAKALELMQAQLDVPNDSGLNVKKNVVAVETRDYWRDSAESPTGFGFHWNNNAETYFLIGNGMGEAMTGLVESEGGDSNTGEGNTETYEAENYSRKNGCVKKSDNSGFTGSGYMDFGDKDTWIQWNKVKAYKNGNFKLIFRYANGGSRCPSTIRVNGTGIGKVRFRNTGGWGKWKTNSITVQLKKGNNKIRVTAHTTTGGPNLDHMKIPDSSGNDDNNDNDNYSELSCTALGAECGMVRGKNDTYKKCGTCSGGQACMANRCEDNCSLDQIDDGKMTDLFAYVPVQYTDTDISDFGHAVETVLLPRVDVTAEFPNVSRTDFRQKQLVIDFGNKTLSLPMTLSFKFIPRQDDVKQTIMESSSFTINQNGKAVDVVSQKDNKTITTSGSELKTTSCNHYAIVISKNTVSIYINGRKQESSNNVSFLGISGKLTIGAYEGKVWDLRLFNTDASQTDIKKLAETCDDRLPMKSPFEGYSQYLCGVYKCIFWPEGITDSTTENLQYQLHGQDMVFEHNVLFTGMYKYDNLCDKIDLTTGARFVQLTESYRKRWVNKFTFLKPWGNYVLHENFHSYQKAAGSGPKFLLEASANWGGYSQRPGTEDNALLGMYTLQPHYALYAIQNSPIKEGIIDIAKGGHQYGAGVFFEYLTEFYLTDRLIGDIFNDPDNNPTSATYKLLKKSGFDMRDVFAEFASKITTWDWPIYGPGYADAEKRSYTRLFNKNKKNGNPYPDEEVDNKIAVSYDGKGTGSWVSVPKRYKIGSWAFNAYEVSVDAKSDYRVGIKPAAKNPDYAEFRARVVVYNESTGKRTYRVLKVGGPGEAKTIDVKAEAGEKLYFVVSSTPSTVFKEWDAYDYDYLIQQL